LEFEFPLLRFGVLENEQFGMLCSIDGQARQLIFRVADNNNMSIARSHLTDSMTSLTSLSAISSLNQTNKTEVLQHLAKAIAEERCLLDKVNLSLSYLLKSIFSLDFTY
jgi:hypothetical protein